MKRFLILALCCLTLAMPILACADAAPISMEDIDLILHNGHETVQDYVDDFQPTGYSWYFEGEQTGNTIFTLGLPGGSITMSVNGAKNYQDDEMGLVGSTQLEGEVLTLKASLTGAYWDSAAFDKLALPRGVVIGDTKDKLQAAIGGLEFMGLEPDEYEEDYDEIASSTLALPVEGDGPPSFYGFDFFLSEGVLAIAQLQYYTESE